MVLGMWLFLLREILLPVFCYIASSATADV